MEVLHFSGFFGVFWHVFVGILRLVWRNVSAGRTVDAQTGNLH